MITKKISAYGRKKEIKEVGTYEVQFNKQLRGPKVTFFTIIYLKKSRKQRIAFFPFLFVKKNKMPDLGNDGVGGGGERGEGEISWWGGGGGVGRDNKKYCTYNTFIHSFLHLALTLSLTHFFLSLFNSISH